MPSVADAPQFTVVVATYNRPQSLETCLRCLAAQDLARDAFEVLVVDDGSPSPQRVVVERFSNEIAIRVIEQVNAGPASARNAGAREARGRYLAFTDDDCRPDPGWLTALLPVLDGHPRALVGGPVFAALENIYSSASQYLVEFLYEFFGTHHPDQQFFVTANCAVDAARFRDVNGFDVSFPFAAAEDRDLCDRWQERGNELIYAGQARVGHAHALNARSFCRQHFTYGRGGWFLERARSSRAQTRTPVRLRQMYPRLVRFLFNREDAWSAIRLSALLAVSQVTFMAGYFWQARAASERRPAARPVL